MIGAQFTKKYFTLASLGFLVVLVATTCFGQQREVWQSISNKGVEFAAHIPPDMIVINEDDDYPRLILSSQDVRLDITVKPNSGKKDVAITTATRTPAESKITPFELGDIYGRVSISERPDRFATVINASSGKKVYFVAAYARIKDHPKVMRFLASLKFGGKQLFTIPNMESEPAGKATEVEDLKSSEIVREYLKKPVNNKAEVSYQPLDPAVPSAFGQNGEPRESNPNETRSIIVLRMPKPAYRPANGLGVSGTVSVQVTMMGTGQIGAIVADSKLDRGLAESAVDAAKQIKFIPATVNGQPVDVRRTFVYSFFVR